MLKHSGTSPLSASTLDPITAQQIAVLLPHKAGFPAIKLTYTTSVVNCWVDKNKNNTWWSLLRQDKNRNKQTSNMLEDSSITTPTSSHKD